MSEPITGFVFGHYDSRGGTTMIIADNYEQALEHYSTKTFGYKKDDPDYEMLKNGISSDYLGKATLEGYSGECERDLEELGRVLQAGEEQDAGWHEPVILLFESLTEDERLDERPTPAGYWQPIWNDDAFGFFLTKASQPTLSKVENTQLSEERLKFLHLALQGEITRDRALILCGNAFSPEYCDWPLGYFFENGKFDQKALLNHVEIFLDCSFPDWSHN